MSNAHLPREAGRSQGSVLVLGSSLTIMGSVMVAPIIPKLIAEFAASEPRVEVLAPLAITGPALAIAIFAPLAGWLADGFGRKLILIFATLLYALLGAAPALLNDLQSIVIARFLFGISEAMVMTCCTALIADYWQGERRLRYINAQVISIAIGVSAAAPLGTASLARTLASVRPSFRRRISDRRSFGITSFVAASLRVGMWPVLRELRW